MLEVLPSVREIPALVEEIDASLRGDQVYLPRKLHPNKSNAAYSKLRRVWVKSTARQAQQPMGRRNLK